ncbi:hypothetical protein SLA2020_101170 [Shorea laevis]
MGKGEAWAAVETHRNRLNDNTVEGASDNLEKLENSFNAYDSSGDWNEKEKSKQAEDSFNAYDSNVDWIEKDKSKQVHNLTIGPNKLDELDAQSQIGPAVSPKSGPAVSTKIGPAISPNTGPNNLAVETQPLELAVTIERDESLEIVQDTMEKGRAEDSFWAGMESETGEISKWMKIKERVKPKRSRKRAKSCSSVYRNAKPCGGKEGKGSRRKLTNLIPTFIPTASNQEVVGESITDNGIRNRNRIVQETVSNLKAKDMWDFAKKVGVVAMGSEEEVIQQIEKMETRDKATRDNKVAGEKGASIPK